MPIDFINEDFINSNVFTPVFEQALAALPKEGKTKFIRDLTNGITSGLGIKDIVRQMDKTLTSLTKDAERIVRTESHRLVEKSHNEVFLETKKFGIDTQMQLVATLDNRTRPQSAQMDGASSNDEGEFKYPDGNYYIPGDPAMPAKWAINDRERAIQIIDGETPPLRRTGRGIEGITEYKTFEKWSKDKGLTKNIYGQILFPG